MNVFNHSGAQGDIIYSLPTIKRLGGGILKLNVPEDIFWNIRPLLMNQDYIHEVIGKCPQIQATHDLDLFRGQSDLHKNHLVLSHMRAFGVDEANWTEPWLSVPRGQLMWEPFAIVNRTPRYPAEGFDWDKEIEYLKDTYGNVCFVGDAQDNIFGLKHVRLHSSFDLAMLISEAQMITGNPSLCLAIAEGLGRTYRMVQPDGITNCNMYTTNETIINK